MNIGDDPGILLATWPDGSRLYRVVDLDTANRIAIEIEKRLTSRKVLVGPVQSGILGRDGYTPASFLDGEILMFLILNQEGDALLGIEVEVALEDKGPMFSFERMVLALPVPLIGSPGGTANTRQSREPWWRKLGWMLDEMLGWDQVGQYVLWCNAYALQEAGYEKRIEGPSKKITRTPLGHDLSSIGMLALPVEPWLSFGQVPPPLWKPGDLLALVAAADATDAADAAEVADARQKQA